MQNSIVWLHEDALRMSHPVFNIAPVCSRVIHIWDDEYLKKADYSLKRLVFLYETLCELPVEIIRGDTIDTLKCFKKSRLYIPSSSHVVIQKIIDTLSPEFDLQVVQEEPFVRFHEATHFARFFTYWGKAKKTAFLINGNQNVCDAYQVIKEN